MTYGYCRISTKHQSITRQEQNISAYDPTAIIIKEVFTGTTTDRPAFNRLIKTIKSGDILVFDEVSRMSRNAAEGIQLYKQLYERGVNLVFLKEHHIDTVVFADTLQIATVGNEIADTYIQATNKVLMLLAEKQIQIAFDKAQAEVDMLHKRTSEGMRAAGAKNEYDDDGNIIKYGSVAESKLGKTVETSKSRTAKELIKALSKDFDGTKSDKEILDGHLINISRNSFYKYKGELHMRKAILCEH